MLLKLLQLVVFLVVTAPRYVVVRADFGDTVGDINVCPAFTTCPVVCVATVGDCPNRCPTGLELCLDGHCRDDCTVEEYDNPCDGLCVQRPLACPKVDNNLTACYAEYQSFYDAQELCIEQQAEQLSSLNPKAGVFVFVFTWIAVVTAAVLFYCRLNGRSSPSSFQFLEGGQAQLGFRYDPLGTALYYATVVTIWGFQFLLMILIILYYVSEASISAFQAVLWEDEKSILFTFEIVWAVGFVWTFLMKWPQNLRALFWRRCALVDANYVAVWTPNELAHGVVTSDTEVVGTMRRFLNAGKNLANTFMSMIFSVDTSIGNGRWTYCPVKTDQDGTTRYFVHNFRRYNFQNDKSQFVPGLWKERETIKELYNSSNGLTSDDVDQRKHVVGLNMIEMPKPTFWSVMVKEFTQPYYTYQTFIMLTWLPLWYYYMAIVQSSVIIIGGFTMCLFQYRNEKSLYRFTHMEGSVQVLRDGQFQRQSQADLVPGDIVMVEPGLTYCDMVLVKSIGVLVDESALTGESNPVPKTAIDPAEGDLVYGSTPAHKRHTIQAGCTILESEHGHNHAVVVRTGSYTTKGELLREIFAYQRHQFKFDVEVGIVVVILFCFAMVGFAIVFTNLSYDPVYGWFYGLYAVSSIMPPLLPTVFTVSVGVSDNRLSKKGIACTNSEDILVAGKVKRAFFDKTGTLTKQGLEFIGARSNATWGNDAAPLSDDMSLGMATCHSLTRSAGGSLIGNPVDRTMFAASGATLRGQEGSIVTIADAKGNKAEILKHFDFDHQRMTQSVIVKTGGKIVAFVKGSGESMQQICTASSLPAGFDSDLRATAKAGVYQITMATKSLPADTENKLSDLSRDELEKDLTFIGVVNFKNVLREETPDVIRQLEAGEVRCVMITGDSVLTGVCIAKESGIIAAGKTVYYGMQLDGSGEVLWVDENDERISFPYSSEVLRSRNVDLAVSGAVWDHLSTSDAKVAEDLAEHIRVYGRCTPLDKVSVVTNFVDRGYITLMCGDGGNDCGALKTAHVGIALSDAEASIVSPFTSLDKTITSVLDVLKEGRCALASALASYKFVILYGQITFTVDISNSYFHIQFSEWVWVFLDGVYVICLGFTLPLSKAADVLPPTRPTSSLLGLPTLASVLGVLFIHYTWTLIAINHLFSRDWYACRRWEGDNIGDVIVIGDNYEAETLWVIVGYQFISSSMTYNFGYEWRGNWFSNIAYVSLVAVLTTIHFYVTLVPGYVSCLFRMNCDNEHVLPSVSHWDRIPIANDWNTTLMPMDYRVTLIVFVILNTACVMAWDYFVVNGIRRHYAYKKRTQAVVISPEAMGGGSVV